MNTFNFHFPLKFIWFCLLFFFFIYIKNPLTEITRQVQNRSVTVTKRCICTEYLLQLYELESSSLLARRVQNL